MSNNFYNNTEIYWVPTIEGAKLSGPAIKGDVGVDLIALKEVKKIGSKTTMYDTGISVQPKDGFYIEIVPRSSIVKTGYMLSNSIGIIDPTYTGSLKIVLTRLDESLPEIQVPFSICQLILRPVIPINTIQLLKLDESVRGDGGFGSTNTFN